MVCDEVEISQGVGFMIYNVWMVVIGNKVDMIKIGELLVKIDIGLVGDYICCIGKNEVQIVQWMDEEIWFMVDEVKEYGFVDCVVEVVGKRKVFNIWDLFVYENVLVVLVNCVFVFDDGVVVVYKVNLLCCLVLLECFVV